MGIGDRDTPGQPKRSDTAFEAFETEIPAFSVMLSLFLQLARPKEVGKSVIQVTQGFLGGTLTDLIHPGKLGFL